MTCFRNNAAGGQIEADAFTSPRRNTSCRFTGIGMRLIITVMRHYKENNNHLFADTNELNFQNTKTLSVSERISKIFINYSPKNPRIFFCQNVFLIMHFEPCFY